MVRRGGNHTGIRWRVRTGTPWRDLPPEYGPWPAVATRFDKLAVRFEATVLVAAINEWV
ncbi:transposase [Streptomyces sp. NPDC014636]|uniref:transposase n=1 Tax=Streptomyces sp. NPDC014636 TaxID=3364876 RepID=UPI0036F90A73